MPSFIWYVIPYQLVKDMKKAQILNRKWLVIKKSNKST